MYLPLSLSLSLSLWQAGGTPIKSMLGNWAEQLGCAEATHQTDILSISEEEQESLCVVWGHRGYGLHSQPEFLSKKRIYYATLLREPISRVVSQYMFHVFENTHLFPRFGGEGMVSEHLDFMSFFKNVRHENRGDPWHPSDSPMTKQLCCWFSIYQTDRRLNPCGAVATRATLDCAKKNLDAFVMVRLRCVVYCRALRLSFLASFH